MKHAPVVRPAMPKDREAFLQMWKDFVALAPDEPGNHHMGAINWDRIMDSGNGLQCLVATNPEGALLGFTLYLAFPFTWSRGDACYLQDLFVKDEARGQGVGRAIIEKLREIGSTAGWFKIFWMTQNDNHTAQRLYDKIAQRMDYLRYDLNVGEP